MRTNYEFTLSEGYLLNKKNGKLEEYKPLAIVFDSSKEQIFYKGLFWDGERTICETDFTLYKSVKDFEEGKAASLGLNKSIEQVFYPICKVQAEENKILAWTFTEGRAIQANILGCIVTYDVSRGYVSDSYVTIDEEMPLYSSYEEAIQFNDIIIVDKDGNEIIRRGLLRSIQLDSKQKSALKKFEEAARELRSLGVELGYSSEGDCLICHNKVDTERETYKSEGYLDVTDHVCSVDVELDTYVGYDGLWMRYKD